MRRASGLPEAADDAADEMSSGCSSDRDGAPPVVAPPKSQRPKSATLCTSPAAAVRKAPVQIGDRPPDRPPDYARNRAGKG